MTSTPSTILRLELMGTGDQAGSWGTTTNTNLGTLLEGAIAGLANVSVTSANQALTATDYVTDQARMAMLVLTTTTTANFNVYAPPVSKQYIVYNNTSYTATLYNAAVATPTTPAGTGITIPAGKTMQLWSNGTNFYTLTYAAADINGNAATVTDGVYTTGIQTIGGTKTFSNSPILPTPATSDNSTNAATTAYVINRIANDAPTKSGTGATGTWAISISGNAATVTNGITTSNIGSYAPTLSGTGATGTWGINVTGNSGTVTNGVYTSSFTGSNQSLGTNGYQKLPGGLIIQWGYVSVSPAWFGTATITYPVAFSSAVYSVQANPIGSLTGPGDKRAMWSIPTANTSQFQIMSGFEGYSTVDYYWIAVGV